MSNATANTAGNGNVNSNLETLTADEKKRLFSAEATIRNGRKAYQNIGRALTDIAQFKLYRSTHSTMAKYARDKWDMTTARVSQYQAAYRIHCLLSETGMKPLPASESQCRPLVRIPADLDMDARIIQAWSDVLDAGQPITAKLVNEKVDGVLGIVRTSSKTDDAEAADAESLGTAGDKVDEQSASAELRAMVRELKRKVAYLESALDAEKKAHQRTQAAGGVPTSATAKKLFKAGFRAMVKVSHPDNGGTAEAMAELNELKSTLGI